MRQLACKDLDVLGIDLDEDKNKIRSTGIRELQTAQSKVKILIIPTNEELEIAKQSYNLIT
jgi:Acetate kinase